MEFIMAIKDLKNELATDVAENEAVLVAEAAVAAAEAAIADTTDGGDEAAEAQALAEAQAQLDTAKSKVNVEPTLDAVKSLKITDFGMVSNEMAKSILKAQGKEVKFEEPVTVNSDYYMKPYN